MKIRIEGCTAEELHDWSPHLSLGTVYNAERIGGDLYALKGDDGSVIGTLVCEDTPTAHLPLNAKWVEVTE